MEVPPHVAHALTTLLHELLEGPPGREAYMLNGGDHGLVGSLAALTATQASATGQNGSSIAAHVDHLRYGFSLMNRWSRGEDPFTTADWSRSWQRVSVTDDEWSALQCELRDEALHWKEALQSPRDVNGIELAGMIGSIAHTAYHLGAIRQLQPVARGPRDPKGHA